jgi:hypothetical protein
MKMEGKNPNLNQSSLDIKHFKLGANKMKFLVRPRRIVKGTKQSCTYCLAGPKPIVY